MQEVSSDTLAAAPTSGRAIRLAVLVAALGYFVDIYDLILFAVVRVPSLQSLGIAGKGELRSVGLYLFNMQMIGMLLGGILWGVLGDKRGRLSVLYGSILLYSLANIANGFVHSVPAYAWLRFVAGVGLAGELGAGITLVSELMGREKRGYGTMIVASIGMFGAVAATLVAELSNWRAAYWIGGAMGLALLCLRVGVRESPMFQRAEADTPSRGNLLKLLRPHLLGRYLACVLVGVPLWFVVGILMTLANDFGAALNVKPVPVPGYAVLWCYVGLAVGDVASGALSQMLRSRRKVMALFIAGTGLMIGIFLYRPSHTATGFYTICALTGFFIGYWALFVTNAAEQFGTDLRATTATSAPNFVRGSIVPLTFAFQKLLPSYGSVQSAAFLGAVCILVAFGSLAFLPETFGKELDYVEE